jgi:hypothetical protein
MNDDVSRRACFQETYRNSLIPRGGFSGGNLARERAEARSHECERCTQECVRHDLASSAAGAAVAFRLVAQPFA